jgi:lactam utilization protein B
MRIDTDRPRNGDGLRHIVSLFLGAGRIPVSMDTICIHADSKPAVATAKAVEPALAGAGVALRAFDA